jgi:hypothetical protein
VQHLTAGAFSYASIEAFITLLLQDPANAIWLAVNQFGISNVVNVLALLELPILIPLLLLTSPIWLPLLIVFGPFLLVLAVA